MFWSAELQIAVYECLTELLPETVGVHNAVPPETERKAPYVVIGAEITGIPGAFETQDSAGREETFYVHGFDNAHGSLRLKRIMDTIDRKLHDALFELGDPTTIAIAKLRNEFYEMRNEEVDDSAYFWRHGAIRYRALIHGVPAAPAST